MDFQSFGHPEELDLKDLDNNLLLFFAQVIIGSTLSQGHSKFSMPKMMCLFEVSLI